MNADKEKDLIEKINRLEEEIDMSNNIQKTFNSDLKKQLDDAESRIKRLLIRFEQFEYEDNKDEK